MAGARGRVRRQDELDAEVRGLVDAHRSRVAEHNGDRIRRRRRAEGGRRRPDPGERQRAARARTRGGRPGGRVPGDGPPGGDRRRAADVPERRGHEAAQARRGDHLRLGRRPADLPPRMSTHEKLEPFGALIGEWATESTHRLMEGTVIRGRTTYEWLEGRQFLIQRAVTDHPDIPDSISVIGVMEGEDDLSMQYFDSRGVHRVSAIGFDGKELTTERDAPGFDQRSSATLSDDGTTLAGVSQLNQDDQGFRDDLAFTYRRA